MKERKGKRTDIRLWMLLVMMVMGIIPSSAQKQSLQTLFDAPEQHMNNSPGVRKASGDVIVVDLSQWQSEYSTTLTVHGGKRYKFMNGTITANADLVGPLLKVTEDSEVELASTAHLAGGGQSTTYLTQLTNGGVMLVTGGSFSPTTYVNAVLVEPFMGGVESSYFRMTGGTVNGNLICNNAMNLHHEQSAHEDEYVLGNPLPDGTVPTPVRVSEQSGKPHLSANGVNYPYHIRIEGGTVNGEIIGNAKVSGEATVNVVRGTVYLSSSLNKTITIVCYNYDTCIMEGYFDVDNGNGYNIKQSDVNFIYLKGMNDYRLSLEGNRVYVRNILSAEVSSPSIIYDDYTALLTLSCDTEGATIYYTTNGKDPRESGTAYSNPFTLRSAGLVRVAAYKDGTWSEVVEMTVLPAFSIYNDLPAEGAEISARIVTYHEFILSLVNEIIRKTNKAEIISQVNALKAQYEAAEANWKVSLQTIQASSVGYDITKDKLATLRTAIDGSYHNVYQQLQEILANLKPGNSGSLQDLFDDMANGGQGDDPTNVETDDDVDLDGDVTVKPGLQILFDGSTGEGGTTSWHFTGGNLYIDTGATVEFRNVNFDGTTDNYIYVSGTLIIDVNVTIYNIIHFIYVRPGGKVIWRGGNGTTTGEAIHNEGGTVEYRGGSINSTGGTVIVNITGTIYIYDGEVTGTTAIDNRGGATIYIYGGWINGGVDNSGIMNITGGRFTGTILIVNIYYNIVNRTGGDLTITGGEIGTGGGGSIWSDEDLYIGGDVRVTHVYINIIKRIHIIMRLTTIIQVHVFNVTKVIYGQEFITGGNGYTLSTDDLNWLNIIIPEGWRWVFDIRLKVVYIRKLEPNDAWTLQGLFDDIIYNNYGYKGTTDNPYPVVTDINGLDMDGEVHVLPDLHILFDGGDNVRQFHFTGGNLYIDNGAEVTIRNYILNGGSLDYHIYVSGTLIVDINVNISLFMEFIHVLPGGRVIWRGGNSSDMVKVIVNEGGTVEIHGGTLTATTYTIYNIRGYVNIYGGNFNGCTLNCDIMKILAGMFNGGSQAGLFNVGTVTIQGGTFSGMASDGSELAMRNGLKGIVYLQKGTLGGGEGTLQTLNDVYLSHEASLGAVIAESNARLHITDKPERSMRVTFGNGHKVPLANYPIIFGDLGYELTEEDAELFDITPPDMYTAEYDEYTKSIMLYCHIPTAVREMDANNEESDTWYTINGQRLTVRPVKRGIYIQNGRKVVIK